MFLNICKYISNCSDSGVLVRHIILRNAQGKISFTNLQNILYIKQVTRTKKSYLEFLR